MVSPPRNISFLRKLLERLRKYRAFRLAKAWLFFLFFIALFGDFIANDKPLFCRYEGRAQFPVLQDVLGWKSPFNGSTDWDSPKITSKIFPLIPYHFDSIDPLNSQFKSPFGKQNVKSLRYRHWLGTDQLGRDVLAAMIIGARISFEVGFLGIGLAALIGILLGSLGGYFGDKHLDWSRWNLVFTFVLLVVFSWLVYVLPIYWGVEESRGLVFLGFLVVFLLLNWLFFKLAPKNRTIKLPLDQIILRLLEVFKSIPKLLLILVISAIFAPSVFLVAFVIGVTHWPSIALFVRGEMKKVREKEYLLAAQLQGIPSRKILIRHALPNALGPAMIAIMLGLGSAILAESFLSFIGLGIPADLMSWGKLLALARENISAWWLGIFPGLAIFLTIYSTNRIGELLMEEIKGA